MLLYVVKFPRWLDEDSWSRESLYTELRKSSEFLAALKPSRRNSLSGHNPEKSIVPPRNSKEDRVVRVYWARDQEGEECRKVREASRNQIKQCLQAISMRFVLFFLGAIRSLLRVLGRKDTIRFILSKGHSNLCRTGLKDNHIRRDPDRKWFLLFKQERKWNIK